MELENDDLAPPREAARRHKAAVVCDMSERVSKRSRGTIYKRVGGASLSRAGDMPPRFAAPIFVLAMWRRLLGKSW